MIHQDDERGPSPDELVWFHGRLVESDHPDLRSARLRRKARRRQEDMPEDTEQYDTED